MIRQPLNHPKQPNPQKLWETSVLRSYKSDKTVSIKSMLLWGFLLGFGGPPPKQVNVKPISPLLSGMGMGHGGSCTGLYRDNGTTARIHSVIPCQKPSSMQSSVAALHEHWGRPFDWYYPEGPCTQSLGTWKLGSSNYNTGFGEVYELYSELSVSPLTSPIILPYIIPFGTPFFGEV